MCHEDKEVVRAQQPVEQEYRFPGHELALQTVSYGYTPGEQKPALVIIHDIFGVSKFYRDMARRLSAEGFAVLLPDLFQREGALTEQTLEAAYERQKRHSATTALRDLLAIVDLLHNEERQVGILGFCLGGRYALCAASQLPHVAACVVYYPTLVLATASAEIERLHAPVLGFVGENDRLVASEHIQAYQEAARKAGKEVDFTIYPEVGHAFLTFAHERSGVSASRDSWSRGLAFFKDHLS
ncbi:MAG TPA: dienelactone hydrolase family protein [Ktedonobacteraceae bacterium]